MKCGDRGHRNAKGALCDQNIAAEAGGCLWHTRSPEERRELALRGSSLDPTAGPPNRLVTITGTSFAASGNTVKFGAVVAAVVSESVTVIVALVPFMAAGSQPVTAGTSDPSAFTVNPAAGFVPAFRRRRR